MTINRRHLLGASAGLVAAAGLNRFGLTPAFAQSAPAYKPEEGATLRLLRWVPFVPGGRGSVAGQHQEVHRCYRRPGTHRQGKLGGRSPESRRCRQCRLGTGHGHELV